MTAGPPTVVDTRQRERLVPLEATLANLEGEPLAIERPEHAAASLAMHETVEPHLADPMAQVRVVEQLQRTADVVLVDVGHDEGLVGLVGHRQQPGSDLFPAVDRAGVDQHAVDVASGAVLDDQRVSVTGGQHLDREHRQNLLRRQLDVDLAVGDEQ